MNVRRCALLVSCSSALLGGTAMRTRAQHSDSTVQRAARVDSASLADVDFAVPLGVRRMDGSWGAARRQVAFGVGTAVAPRRWPVDLVAQLAYSWCARTRCDLQADAFSQTTVDAGVRRRWAVSRRLQPFVGGGASLFRIHGDKQQQDIPPGFVVCGFNYDCSRDATAVGGYVEGGAMLRGGPVRATVDARYAAGSRVALYDHPVVPGGLLLALALGWGGPLH